MGFDVKVGDIVIVYGQPYIGRLREGEAELIEKVEGYTNQWKVRFLNQYDGKIVQRLIVDPDKINKFEDLP